MIKLLEDNTVVCSDGSVVNSNHPEKTTCVVSKALAEAFEYKHDLIYTRPDIDEEHIDNISFSGSIVSYEICRCLAEDVPDRRARLVTRENETSHRVHIYKDDLADLPARVKKFIDIVSDRATYEASLVPRTIEVTEIGRDGKPVTKMQTVMVPEDVKIIDGVATLVPAHEAKMKMPIIKTEIVHDQQGNPVMVEPDTK